MAEKITLTRQERLNYLNQFKILKTLYPGEESYYDNFITILQRGYEYHYSDLFGEIYESMPEDKSIFVLDVLEMYRGIIYSYMALKRNEINATLNEKDVAFPGFDGNNEYAEMRYVQYFIDDLDRYNEIQAISKYYNSHSPMTEHYKKMLIKWNAYEDKYSMNEKQILELIK